LKASTDKTALGDITLSVDMLGSPSVNVSGITSAGAASAGTTLTSAFTNTIQAGFANYTLTGLNDAFRPTASTKLTNAGGGGVSVAVTNTTQVNSDVTYNLNGGAGNDSLEGGDNADVIDGGAGNDSVYMYVGVGINGVGSTPRQVAQAGISDTLIGGAGTDTLFITGSTGTIIADLSSGTDQVSAVNGGAAGSNTAPQTGFESLNVSDSAGALTVTTSTTGGTITGTAFADSITGNTGNDVVIMHNATQDTANVSTGTDTLVLATGTGGTVWTAGGVVDLTSTTDQLTYSGAGVAQTGFENADLSAATTLGFNVTAVSSGSQIAGSAAGDTITGGAGNDSVYGVVGDDTIDGGAGNDTIFIVNNISASSAPFAGNTGGLAATSDAKIVNIEFVRISGSGSSTVDLTGQTEAFDISASGAAISYANLATATPAINITGGGGADTITGSSLADTIAGGAGADVINSGSGNDNVTGGTDADIINVGTGVDTVVLGTADSGTATTNWTFTHGSAATNSATTIDAGDFWTLSGIDVITGMSAATTLIAADVLDLPGATATASTINGTSGTALTAFTAGLYGTARGSWSGTTFSYDAAGADLLVIYGDGAAYDAVVLVGSGATPPNFG